MILRKRAFGRIAPDAVVRCDLPSCHARLTVVGKGWRDQWGGARAESERALRERARASLAASGWTTHAGDRCPNCSRGRRGAKGALAAPL